VLNIAQMYGWECEALKGVNYAQWRDYFLGKEDYPKLKDNLVKANMDLAKKQMTWFRRNKRIHWQSAPVNVANVVDLVTTFLDNTVTH
ncbi:MAG TPA: hypothetical protein VL989_02540, partial [Candidatus Sulfotelmatobacter sp.]|nr:hypothetical protein [Candidatus Sulfotelmatobacter sp.]